VDPNGLESKMSPAEVAAAKARLAEINARLDQLDKIQRDAAKFEERLASLKEKTRSAQRDLRRLQRRQRDNAIEGKEARGEALFPAVGSGESAGRRETTDAYGKSPGIFESLGTAIWGRGQPIKRPEGDTESLGPPPPGSIDVLNAFVKATPSAHANVGAVFVGGAVGSPRVPAPTGAVRGSRLTWKQIDDLSFDPDVGRATRQAVSEVEIAIAAERAGLIETFTARGGPGADLVVGSTQLSVKRPDLGLLTNPRKIGAMRAGLMDPNLKWLLDIRGYTNLDIAKFLLRAEELGIPRDRFILPPRSEFPTLGGG